jgi:ribosomal protein S21
MSTFNLQEKDEFAQALRKLKRNSGQSLAKPIYFATF